MILELFTNICMSMVMFIRGNPNEKKINRNIELLKKTEWFKQIYLKNEELFKKDEHLRYIIGWAKVEKSLKNEKETAKLRGEILEAINEK
ncbi:hypothetical protein JOC75_003349 [Metabacillus crassostreae]|uniref:hypothetical protein n=1 Tax=Metabacillus crassostreae TaxID=929098 RepID=UPI0019570DC4|nr:hypothetical protein [Metabacillus crassostreae]MBM7605326.1 hypothetical protein [Metabacillus crassostreae]